MEVEEWNYSQSLRKGRRPEDAFLATSHVSKPKVYLAASRIILNIIPPSQRHYLALWMQQYLHFYRRVILLFDLDCFYASAEMLRRPDFRNKPLAVSKSISS